MKRLSLVIIFIAILIIAYVPSQNNAYASDWLLNISASSGIVIDAKTGKVLWEKYPDDKRAIASTTKIMTAIIAIERESLDTTVTIGEAVSSAGRYGMKLQAGELMTLEDLLYALMLNSANDAAIAVADHVGGSVDKFIDLMNKKAVRIGAKNTNFTNPHGLTDGAHRSTARDLSLIAKYAMGNEVFARIVAARDRKLSRADPKKPGVAENRNRLLQTYPGTTGVKTGYTSEAGYCLVSSAETETVSLIAVVLGSKSYKAAFDESEALLNHGFSLYEKKQLISKGIVYKTVDLRYGKKVDLVADSDVEAFVRRSSVTTATIENEPDIKFPVKKGDVIGRILFKQYGSTVAVSNLVAKQDVEKPSIFQIISFNFRQFFQSIFKKKTGHLDPAGRYADYIAGDYGFS